MATSDESCREHLVCADKIDVSVYAYDEFRPYTSTDFLRMLCNFA